MKIDQFEDIVAWQKAKILVLDCYKYLGVIKDYSFKSQILSAAVSIMNNIAEGFERKGDKEFRHFLFISKGSCGEVRSMLYLALELEYLDQQRFGSLYNQSVEISKILSGLIKTLN